MFSLLHGRGCQPDGVGKRMTETIKQDVIVGVDLGGTKILAGIFSPELRLLQTVKLSTKASRGFESVVERVARCVRDAVDEAD
ncbi:MAG: hypothetical protein RJB04_879, partial [Verrucomicrobiota bacterium]